MRNRLNSVAARFVGALAVVVCCRSALAAATVYYAPLEPRPNGGRKNLGAYGNTPYATLSPIAGAFLRVR